MGYPKASKSPPSGSWLRRKEKVRGLYALPRSLQMLAIADTKKNHRHLRGGYADNIKNPASAF